MENQSQNHLVPAIFFEPCKLYVIARYSDRFIALFVSVGIGRSNNFSIVFAIVQHSHLKTALYAFWVYGALCAL